MNYVYCEQWSNSYKEALRPIDEKKAKQKHEKNQTYSALVDNIHTPKIALQLVDNAIFISFLDEKLRDHWEFHIQKHLDCNDFILGMVVCRHYYDDSDELLEAMIYIYNGFLKKNFFTYTGKLPNGDELTYSEDCLDFSENQIVYPNFGQYDEIIEFCERYRKRIIDNPLFPQIDFNFQELYKKDLRKT